MIQKCAVLLSINGNKMVSLLRSAIYIQHEIGMEDQKQMGKEEEE